MLIKQRVTWTSLTRFSSATSRRASSRLSSAASARSTAAASCVSKPVTAAPRSATMSFACGYRALVFKLTRFPKDLTRVLQTESKLGPDVDALGLRHGCGGLTRVSGAVTVRRTFVAGHLFQPPLQAAALLRRGSQLRTGAFQLPGNLCQVALDDGYTPVTWAHCGQPSLGSMLTSICALKTKIPAP